MLTRSHRQARPVSEPSADRVDFPFPGPGASVGKRWRFERNCVIYLAAQHGVSQRVLANVFDLPRSRIHAILKQFRDHFQSL